MGYQFEAVVVDDVNQEIRVDGAHRPVEPQVFNVLMYLIEQRHRVVPKDELLDEVWGSRFVSAAAVTSRIKSARQAIGDSGKDQRLIRTVHGRGYRFVATLDQDSGDASPAPTTPPSDADRARPPAERTFDEGWPLTGRDREREWALDQVQAGELSGLLLTGPAGLGKTRLARAVIEAASASGLPSARINGQLGASSVPLAALAHLLPADVTDLAGLHGELARTVLLQRARTAVHEMAGDKRLVLMVDDVERVDSLSQALLGSLIADGTVFAVMTQRVTGDEPLAMGHLVRSEDVAHLRLDPVPADQMLALLGRVLEGPVQPQTGDAMVAAADGYPGVMRQLVEGSLASGTLSMRGNVWRIEGRLTPPGDMAAAIGARLDALDDNQRDASELLAIAGDLELDVAFALIDEEVLDQLELEGLISVRALGPSTRIRLAHPLYGEILTDSITALRERRHRSNLANALTQSASTNAADRLQLVRLRVEADAPVDDELLIESAVLALTQGDTTLALRLLRRVTPAGQTARHQQLLGEVLYLRGRFDEAGEVWQAIDLESLDDEIAAGVIRRLSTWMFYGCWRYDEAIEFLDGTLERFEGDLWRSLDSYWGMIAAIDGNRAGEVIERAERSYRQAAPHAAVDYLSGMAMAHFVLGQYRAALTALEECNRRARGLQPTIYWTDLGYANFVEILCQVELGDIDAGWATYERISTPGEPPDFGFAAISAGRLALATGEWHQVIDWLDPKIQITEALGITTNGRPLQANAAIAAYMVGDTERAAADAATMRSDLPSVTNVTKLDVYWAVLNLESLLGLNPAAGADLIAAAESARASNLPYMESLLLSAAAYNGSAVEAVARLGELDELIDGELIGLRHRAALVLSNGEPVEPLIEEFERRRLRLEAELLRRAAAGPATV